MKVNDKKFASLGPFKVVSKLVTFQCLWAFLRGCERGKTAHAWAGAFKFAPAARRMLKSRSPHPLDPGSYFDRLTELWLFLHGTFAPH
jgi:hypothetical protein